MIISQNLTSIKLDGPNYWLYTTLPRITESVGTESSVKIQLCLKALTEQLSRYATEESSKTCHQKQHKLSTTVNYGEELTR